TTFIKPKRCSTVKPKLAVESAVQLNSDRDHTDKKLDDEIDMSLDDLFSDKELMLSANDEDETTEQEINTKLPSFVTKSPTTTDEVIQKDQSTFSFVSFCFSTK
ncbi:unnamed protein product, partial [Rotaria sp. Silwood2]